VVSPPANIHGPFRAKGGKLFGPKNVGNDKATIRRPHPRAEESAAQIRKQLTSVVAFIFQTP
jgi:hypothetical protein